MKTKAQRKNRKMKFTRQTDNENTKICFIIDCITLTGQYANKRNRKAVNRNWSNQKANPALKTKASYHTILKYQSNIASKPATGMQRYTMTKNLHLTSLKAVELGSLVHVMDVSNFELREHAFSATETLQKLQTYEPEFLGDLVYKYKSDYWKD